MGPEHTRREVVSTHDTVSALSPHVSIRFFSVANIELGAIVLLNFVCEGILALYVTKKL
jgi:hypothetical protein